MKAWLSLSGADVELRDFFEFPFTESELRTLLGERLPSEQFSWNSPSWRQLGLNREDLSEDNLVGLMLTEPRLIRRPLIEINGKLLAPISNPDQIKEALAEAFK